MPTIHREPRFTYDDLVDLVEGQLRVVELTAVNAEIGGPGERLWLSEPGTGADVYRLWRVAATMGWEPAKAHKTLSAWDDYRRWVREGAAHARATVPVHRPAGDTGLPDVLAAMLMTVACGSEPIVPDRPSPVALPDELAPWYVFSQYLGASVAVADEATYAPDADPRDYMHLVPVAMVLDLGRTVRDGLIVSLLPHNGFGVAYDEEAIRAGGGTPLGSAGVPQLPGHGTDCAIPPPE
ncbi:hypothetical protein ACF081_12105 [Streptomyces longwoodensis]|uniref:hypothetical protein n=1 Tax=Streptomyces longwoodensis TaxID=68231 RepID=UPI0036FD897D